MKFLKVVVLPVVILGVALIVTMAVYTDLPFSSKIMLAPLLAEVSLLFYYWRWKLTRKTKASLFHIYMTFLVLLVFVVKIIATLLYSNGTITWMPYSVIYFVFVGIVFIAGLLLKWIYGGVNTSIKMQHKGEGNIARMKELCVEIMHVLELNRHEATKAIRAIKQVLDAVEYSDPVTHKKVVPMEKAIISKLETTLKHAKSKLFNKVRDVAKGSSGVLHMLEERNNMLREYK